jgi:hypothetical protein
VLSLHNAVRTFFAAIGSPVQDSHLVDSVLLGIRKSAPPQPRYRDTWDISKVVQFIKQSWPNNDLLSTEVLRNKCIILLRLCLLARSSDLARALAPPVPGDDTLVHISFESTKETRAAVITQPLPVRTAVDPDICPVRALRDWLSRSETWRTHTSSRFLFLRLDPPHEPLTSQRIAKVTLDIMASAGIDTKKFKAASTRSAAATKALDSGVDVDSVMKLGRWSSRTVFDTFYNRSLRVPDIIQLSTQVHS